VVILKISFLLMATDIETMTRALTTISLVWASVGFCQNYQPLVRNSLQVFYQESYFAQGEEYNMWGTRIDSVVSINGDSTYYNYPIVRDTIVEYGNGGECVWWDAPNWNGLETRIDGNGNAYFRNSFGDTIRIYFRAQLGESWEAYRFDNGDSLIASVSSIDWLNDGWMEDSVKTIEFIRYSPSGIVPDPMNHVSFELYKSHGFRKMIDFVRFPSHVEPIYQVDPNTINSNSVPYKVANELRATPNVGDGFYKKTRWEAIDCCELHETFTSGLALAITGNSAQLTVHWQRNSQIHDVVYVPNNYPLLPPWESTWSGIQSQQVTEIYVENNDSTYRTLKLDSDGSNLMPREKWSGYIFNNSHENCPPTVTVSPCWGPIEWSPESTNDDCLNGPIFFKCLSGSEQTFVPYVGFIANSNWNVDYSAPTAYSYNSGYEYLKAGNVLCGEFAMVGMTNHNDNNLSIKPNPAKGYFEIKLPTRSGNGVHQVVIYDVLGQIRSTFNFESITTHVDVSEWPNGVYYVVMTSNSGSLHNETVLVQH
jgi:hypothetical protein